MTSRLELDISSPLAAALTGDADLIIEQNPATSIVRLDSSWITRLTLVPSFRFLPKNLLIDLESTTHLLRKEIDLLPPSRDLYFPGGNELSLWPVLRSFRATHMNGSDFGRLLEDNFFIWSTPLQACSGMPPGQQHNSRLGPGALFQDSIINRKSDIQSSLSFAI